MEYNDYLDRVAQLPFVPDRLAADAGIKAVVGTLANRLRASEAEDLIARLPEPLTVEKLRQRRPEPLELSPEQYVEHIREQLHLQREQADQLVHHVFATVREDVGDETWQQVRNALPDEWHGLLAA